MNDITAATIIGHDLDLLRWCVENARGRAGIPHDWLVVNWIDGNHDSQVATIKKWCKEEKIKYVPFIAAAKPSGDTTEWFLKHLYHAWNALYEHAETKWVARMGSDQFFNRSWLNNLFTSAQRNERAVYHCWTVESPVARNSRHEIKDFGATWDSFQLDRFNRYCEDVELRFNSYPVLDREDTNLYYQHPTRGTQLRPDGCSWLQTKAIWEEFGPMSDQLVDGVTGDVSYFDKIYDAGVPGYLVPKSITYHLVRGESREVQQ